MALSGLDIYKLLPKTNCKDCGFATCLAFAMALAQKKISLDKCPHVTAQAKEALDSASQPPVKLVTIGYGDNQLKIGNETVMYRHEQKFHNPACIGVLIEDTLSGPDLRARLTAIRELAFERVGLAIGPGIICVKNASGKADQFMKAVRETLSGSKLNIILYAKSLQALAEALKVSADRGPLVFWDGGADLEGYARLAAQYKVPLAVTCAGLDDAAALTDKVKRLGVEEIVINMKDETIAGKVQDFTYARRAALKKNFRQLGYPFMAFTAAGDSGLELCEAVTYVAKYASIVVVNNIEKDFILPLLVVRQDIYTDPQKPVQVEAKIYEVGKVGAGSPVIVTTNFSITYFTVAGEVEASKVPTYIICCDAEGMSVLTAWAAEKFTAQRISDMLAACGIAEKVSHKNVIIPGYVSVLSGKLQDVSGWKVSVGPKEASGLPNYLRGWKAV